jgi:peroxiredoxin
MKTYLYLLLPIFLLVNCKKETVAPTAPATQNVRTAAVKTPPPVQRHQVRELTDIEKIFPYDVELMDADGKIISSKDLLETGKPTAVMFWLTTCGPCLRKFQAIHSKYPRWKEEADFNMVAISIDWPKNHEQFVKMTKKKNWPWPVYLDTQRDFKKLMPGNLNGLPQEFLFDKEGNIVHHKKKYSTGQENVLFEKIKKYAS